MPDSVTGLLDPTRILFDLQQGNEIAQGFSGCMEPEEIARRVTDGLSERELEILALLTKGLRDRDIADRLIISESTVKFHMNNVLKKLKAQTRYQALHQAIVNGWIQ